MIHSKFRFCRQDTSISQVDKKALKSVQQKPTCRANLPEEEVEMTTMRQHFDQIEDELKNVKEKLDVTRDERDRALNAVKEMTTARKASAKPSERLASSMMSEVLKMKVKEINSLKLELKKLGGLEIKIKIQELEDELERVNLSKRKMCETVMSQTKELEETQSELEKYKIEVVSLRQVTEKLATLPWETYSEDLPFLAQEWVASEQAPLSNDEKIYEELNKLKCELKLAIEAEGKSNKALEDLALALKEVAMDANQAKDGLASTEEELGSVKEETEQLKKMVRTIEDKYKTQLDDANKEIERYKNTIERLRSEAEESLLAWNDKEMGFVNCIKKAEEDNIRLIESVTQAEMSSKTSREDNFNLRDILKQALSEANVAKEVATVTRIENSQLKDDQLEKDETLDDLSQENGRLREMLKELKQLLSLPSQNNIVSPIHTFQHIRLPSPFKETISMQDVDHNEDTISNSDEKTRNPQRRGTVFFRRFGEVMGRKNLNKKEKSYKEIL